MRKGWVVALAIALAGGACNKSRAKESVCRGTPAVAPCTQAACDSETRNWVILPMEVGAPCGLIGHCNGQGRCVLP